MLRFMLVVVVLVVLVWCVSGCHGTWDLQIEVDSQVEVKVEVPS